MAPLGQACRSRPGSFNASCLKFFAWYVDVPLLSDLGVSCFQLVQLTDQILRTEVCVSLEHLHRLVSADGGYLLVG